LSKRDINVDENTWDTLVSLWPKRIRKKLEILLKVPTELLGSARGMLCPQLNGVTQVMWIGRTIESIRPVLFEMLTKQLEEKIDSFCKNEEVFNKEYWSQYKVKGSPISLDVLGYGSMLFNTLHPLLVVVNNQYQGVWNDLDKFKELDQTDLQEVWKFIEEISSSPMSVTENYISKQQRISRIQAKTLLKLHDHLIKLNESERNEVSCNEGD
jgi:hypothetical protein